MKKILTLLSVFVILSLAAFGAVIDGQWSVDGSGATAPRTLFLQVSGASLSGTMDTTAITSTGMEGGYFWFHVVRNGVDFTYKGQVKAGKIELREVGPQSNRILTLTHVP